jgi:hypothetical protein
MDILEKGLLQVLFFLAGWRLLGSVLVVGCERVVAKYFSVATFVSNWTDFRRDL